MSPAAAQPSATVDPRICEVLQTFWRNDDEGLGTLFSNHLPNDRNLITSHNAQREPVGAS